MDELASAGLRLGLALLKGGNTEVQLAMHEVPRGPVLTPPSCPVLTPQVQLAMHEVLLGEGDRELRPCAHISLGSPEHLPRISRG